MMDDGDDDENLLSQLIGSQDINWADSSQGAASQEAATALLSQHEESRAQADRSQKEPESAAERAAFWAARDQFRVVVPAGNEAHFSHTLESRKKNPRDYQVLPLLLIRLMMRGRRGVGGWMVDGWWLWIIPSLLPPATTSPSAGLVAARHVGPDETRS